MRSKTISRFGFEIRGVPLPFVSHSNTEWGFAMIPFESIVRHQGATDALVHHRQCLVRERLIVHRAKCPMKKPPLMSTATALLSTL